MVVKYLPIAELILTGVTIKVKTSHCKLSPDQAIKNYATLNKWIDYGLQFLDINKDALSEINDAARSYRYLLAFQLLGDAIHKGA